MTGIPTAIEALLGGLAGSLLEKPVDPVGAMVMSMTSDAGPDVFWQQNHNLSLRGRRRWRKRPRPISQVEGFGLHHTGIVGGFGVAEYQVAPWLRVWDSALRDSGDIPTDPPDEHRGQPVVWAHPGLSYSEARRSWAEVQALRTRYLSTPYHSISSPAEELVMNHRAEIYTHHGGKMNSWTWGHAIDGYWKEMPFQNEISRETMHLSRVYKHLKDAGANLTRMNFHFQVEAKPFDPPRVYLETVAIPFARSHKLKIDWDFRLGRGKTVREVMDAA